MVVYFCSPPPPPPVNLVNHGSDLQIFSFEAKKTSKEYFYLIAVYRRLTSSCIQTAIICQRGQNNLSSHHIIRSITNRLSWSPPANQIAAICLETPSYNNTEGSELHFLSISDNVFQRVAPHLLFAGFTE